MPTKDQDLLANIRQQMEARLKELQPAAEEYLRIQQALKRLDHQRPGRKPSKTG